MRRYRDVLVQPGCSLDQALEAGDYARASRIYEECETAFSRHYPRFTTYPAADKAHLKESA
ncbi:hypothetical protein WK94_23380 [Burkholderia ubonensis]|uniref:hypothetical protein n=1 Tax=Burkholderia ubonensis TaxID=101571 RepID=UPI0007575B62|nr:hypothetical protein [Burkholderia ubonensis]KVW40301.1 hypothetical protein WK94_23380 [Burkholderia ubonensis]